MFVSLSAKNQLSLYANICIKVSNIAILGCFILIKMQNTMDIIIKLLTEYNFKKKDTEHPNFKKIKGIICVIKSP